MNLLNMGKYYFIFLAFIGLFLFFSCSEFSHTDFLNVSQEKEIPCSGDDGGPEVWKFWATDLRNNTQYQISAVRMGVSEHACIYVEEEQLGMVSENDIDDFLNTFEQHYQDMIDNFGVPPDVDGNKRVLFLFLDIKDDYTDKGSGGFVAGYFDYINEFDDSDTMNYYNRHSNELDMLYMDTYPSLEEQNKPEAKSTMFHEFQHMICFNRNFLVEKPADSLDTWIEEGLSMAAEHMIFGVKSSRVSYYVNDPYNHIRYGFSLIRWGTRELNKYDDILANYSLSYLFMQFVRAQAGTDKIYKAIIDADGEDIYAFNAVVSNYTGKNIQELFQNFTIANWWYEAVWGTPPDQYSYKEQGIRVRDDYGKPQTVSGGDSYLIQELSNIYVEYNNPSLSAPTDGGASINYLCVNGYGNVDTTDPYDCSANGLINGVFITWNSDIDKESNSEDERTTGTLPNVLYKSSSYSSSYVSNYSASWNSNYNNEDYLLPDPINIRDFIWK